MRVGLYNFIMFLYLLTNTMAEIMKIKIKKYIVVT